MLGESRVMPATAPSITHATRGNASGVTYITITINRELSGEPVCRAAVCKRPDVVPRLFGNAAQP
jgi:hypothetical protein